MNLFPSVWISAWWIIWYNNKTKTFFLVFTKKKTVEPLKISLLLFFYQAPPPYRWGRGHLFIWVGGKKSVQIITTISHNIYFFGLQDAIVRSSRYVVVWTTKKQSKKKISIKKNFLKEALVLHCLWGQVCFSLYVLR